MVGNPETENEFRVAAQPLIQPHSRNWLRSRLPKETFTPTRRLLQRDRPAPCLKHTTAICQFPAISCTFLLQLTLRRLHPKIPANGRSRPNMWSGQCIQFRG
jgi:hypothetical protein